MEEDQWETSGGGQSDACLTSTLMAAAWATAMSPSVFSTSLFAREAASLNAAGGLDELTGADWTTARK